MPKIVRKEKEGGVEIGIEISSEVSKKPLQPLKYEKLAMRKQLSPH